MFEKINLKKGDAVIVHHHHRQREATTVKNVTAKGNFRVGEHLYDEKGHQLDTDEGFGPLGITVPELGEVQEVDKENLIRKCINSCRWKNLTLSAVREIHRQLNGN